jgi:hypothetical protein
MDFAFEHVRIMPPSGEFILTKPERLQVSAIGKQNAAICIATDYQTGLRIEQIAVTASAIGDLPLQIVELLQRFVSRRWRARGVASKRKPRTKATQGRRQPADQRTRCDCATIFVSPLALAIFTHAATPLSGAHVAIPGA